MPSTRPLAPTRRLLIMGVLGVPVAAALPSGSADAAPAAPECLADLIESGAVTRADLVAR